MTKIVGVPRLGMTVTLELTEREARFLDGLLGYGGEALIRVVTENLGRHYIKPYEDDGLQFCKDARREIGYALARIDRARKAFGDTPSPDHSTDAQQEKPLND
jgi:hypothetical protein